MALAKKAIPKVKKTPEEMAVDVRLQDNALQMAKNGMGVQEISKVLSVPSEKVSRAIQFVLKRLAKRRMINAESYRQLLLERIEMALQAIAPKVLEGNLDACAEWRQQIEQAAKLCGLHKQAPNISIVNNVAVADAARSLFGIQSVINGESIQPRLIGPSPDSALALSDEMAE